MDATRSLGSASPSNGAGKHAANPPTLCSVERATIALFGPESPLLYGPVGNGHMVFYKRVHCSPCLTVANDKTPPCRGNNICMSAISVEEVFAAVERYLGKGLQPLCLVSSQNTSV